MSVDALSDLMPGSSPFHYCFNNPLILRDPSGLVPGVEASPLQPGTVEADDEAQARTYAENKERWYRGVVALDATDNVPKGPGIARSADGKQTTWDPVTTNRILTLDSRVQQPAFDFINAAEQELGVQLRVSHAVQTIAEQDKIWRKGRDSLGNKVGATYTNVRGGKSAHNYGLAIDVVLIPNSRTVVSPDIGLIGERYGFEWGGRWKGFVDCAHFQMFWINGKGPK
jgi:hypothetical protein